MTSNFIYNNTSLNNNISNIVFHYSKELPYKNELLKKTINIFEKSKNNKYGGLFYFLYNLHYGWNILSGSRKYTDYKLNQIYKSDRIYNKTKKYSIWKGENYFFPNSIII